MASDGPSTPASEPGEAPGGFSPRGSMFWRRSVPMVAQDTPSECGLACLAMVAASHGHELDMLWLRQRFDPSSRGVTAADLLQMADSLQLQGRGLRAEPEQLAQLALPCVLHWDMNHFVVLVKVRRTGVLVHDPAVGVRSLTWSEVSAHFTGVALEFQPRPDFAPLRERAALSWRRLMGPVQGLGSGLAQVLLLALGLEAFVLLTPFFMQWVVDDVLVSADEPLLVTLGLAFVLLVLFQAATAGLRSWALLALSVQLNQQWLLNVFGHLLRLPLAWFERRMLGDIWSRHQAVQVIQRTLTTSFVEALLDGVMVLLTVLMMALYSLKLLGIALLAMAVYAGLRWALYRPQREAAAEALAAEARQHGLFIESLRGIQALKLFNAAPARRQVYGSQVSETLQAQVRLRAIDAGFQVLQRLLFGLERVAVIWVGALLVLQRELSVGMLLAFFAYKEQFAARVSALVDKAAELAMLRLQGERLADIVLQTPERGEHGGGGAPLREFKGLELRDLWFRHGDQGPDLLRGLHLQLRPGESLAIVGPSGGGKSTLLKLLLGLLEPQRGEVLVDGVPLARFGLARWRDAVGTVMQDDQLFSGSLAGNICLFAPGADMAWIESCARQAGIHEDIVAMPMGYHTLIGDMGAALSGGQRQRLLLARALYKRPLLLVLDEATSALDLEGESSLNESLNRLQVTKLIVAHRPQTIAAATRVLRLADGQLAPLPA